MSVSPSNIEKAMSCLRIVGWDVVDPQEFVQGDAAKLGDEVHDGMDAYNKAGVNPIKNEALSPLAQRLCALALPYAPRPKTGRAEGFFRWTWQGIEFSGRDDWAGTTADISSPPAGVTMPAEVDYKTTGDPTYGVWGMVADAPAKGHLQDPQSLIYAKRRLELTGVDAVFNRWLYIRSGLKKGKPQALPSDAIMERAPVSEAFDRIVMPVARVVDAMKKKGKALDVLSLPPNPNHCRKYQKTDKATGAIVGVCPRLEQCQITAGQQLLAAEGGYDVSNEALAPLLSILRTEQAAPAAAPTAANPTPAISFNPAMSSGALLHNPAPQLAAPTLVAPQLAAPTLVAPQLAAPTLVAPQLAAPTLAAPQLAATAASAPAFSSAGLLLGNPPPVADEPIGKGATVSDMKAAISAASSAADAELGAAVRVLLRAFKQA